MTRRQATLPFTWKGKTEVVGTSELTSLTETVHGLLRLDGHDLFVQWRVTIRTERLSRTEEECEDVQRVVLSLDDIAGVVLRQRWWDLGFGLRLVLTANDLQAFERLAEESGVQLSHPAELVFRLRRRDRVAAQGFAADLEHALAELKAEPAGPLDPDESRDSLPPGGATDVD